MARQIAQSAELGASAAAPAPLVLQISDWIVQEIVAGRLGPGAWIREQDMADRMGTSRGPVREGLRLVEQEGLVEMIPWRGARVVDLGVEEIDDLLEVASALTGLVARLAATHAAPEDIARLNELVEQMASTLERAEPFSRQLALAFEASALIREVCGSAQAGAMLQRVGRMTYWQHRHLLTVGRAWRTEALGLWRKLAAAIAVRDPANAERLARRSLARSKDFIMGRLRRDPRLMSAVAPAELAPLPPRLVYGAASRPSEVSATGR